MPRLHFRDVVVWSSITPERFILQQTDFVCKTELQSKSLPLCKQSWSYTDLCPLGLEFSLPLAGTSSHVVTSRLASQLRATPGSWLGSRRSMLRLKNSSRSRPGRNAPATTTDLNFNVTESLVLANITNCLLQRECCSASSARHSFVLGGRNCGRRYPPFS